MNAIELITTLRNYRVIPKLENGALKLMGNTKDLPADVLANIRSHKDILIAFLEEKQDEAENEKIPAVAPRESYPLTNAQKRIWVLSQFDGGNEAYNISDAFLLKGTIDFAVFEQAYQWAVNKHESLRTCFKTIDDEVVQCIMLEVPFAFIRETVTGKSDLVKYIKEAVKQLGAQPFDLEKAPLFKVKLLHVSAEETVMIFNMHHIISDGWSLGLLIQEVFSTYRKLCTDQPLENQKLAIQYKDYAVWLNERIEGKFGRQASEFWQQRALGAIEKINLPVDFARPEVNSFEGGALKFYFGDAFYQQLEMLARSSQTTIFNIFRSAISITLHKWTNQKQLVIGTPVAGRSHVSLQDQIGLFVNTLPLVSGYESSHSYSEYLSALSKDSLDVFKFQDYPLDLIVEEADIPRDTSRNPLFDVMMVVQNTALGDGSIDIKNQHGFTLNGLNEFFNERVHTDKSDVSAKFDLSFSFAIEPGRKHYVEIEYKTGLFKKSTIQRLYKMFEFVLKQVVENSQVLLTDISVIDPAEHHTILNQFNKPILSHSEKSITEIMESQAAYRSGETALLFGDQSISYLEMDQWANAYANAVSQLPSPKVGLLLARSEKVMYSILGILKTGKAYVPIDVKYPQQRIDYIVNDAALEVLIVDEAGMQKVPASFKGTLLHVDSIAPQFDFTRADEDLKGKTAYLIYTSGSTGQPKGVEITHGNAVAFLKWCLQEFRQTPYQLMYAGTSYCFDLSIFEMFLPLYQGKTIRIIDSAVEIEDYLPSDRNVFINTVPSVVRNLLEMDWSHVVALNMAGEAVPRIFKDVLDFERIEIRNLYGPSEDTTYSTCYRFVKDNLDYVPIGIPVGDTHLYIMDETQQLLPIGVEGEICLSGESIAKGYYNKPELTAEKFIENPLVPGMRLYRTGDLGKWTQAGHVAFSGRMDDQVKVRGFRIELGEIQYQLEIFEEISQAVVLVDELEGEKEIVAYYALNAPLEDSTLLNHLQLNLPGYMIPRYLMKLDAIPLNSNGKVDKKQLPKPQVLEAREIIAPKNESQQDLLACWETVLGRSGFGIEDNFFELGGHSLKATRLKGLVFRKFEKELTLNEIFQYPTILQQSQLLDSKGFKKEQVIERIEVATDQLYTLSFAQERLWVLTKFENVSKAYHMPAAFEVRGALDIPTLDQAIHRVIERHESLRTLFKEMDNVPYQYVVDAGQSTFRITEKTLNNTGDLPAFLQDSWSQPFDLENGPLLRCELIHIGDQLILSFNMHHIISDGWSIGVLFHDVMKSYSLIREGESGALQPLEIQYKDFAIWQRNELTESVLAEQLDYWKNTVFADGVTPLELPYDQLRPEIKTYSGSTFYHSFPKDSFGALKRMATENGVSVFMALMANVGILLKKLSNQSSITIGTPVSGRDSSQLQQQIGFFINTLPIQVHVNGEETVGTLLKQVSDSLLTAFNFQHFPFEKLVELLQPRRDMSRSPLFDVMVVLQNFDVLEGKTLHHSEDLELAKVETNAGNTKYDLTFSFSESEEALHLELEYNTDLFKAATIERFVHQLSFIIEQATSNISAPIKSIGILTESESAKLLAHSDNTHVGYRESETIVSLFSHAVREFPDNIALKVEGKTLTYAELDRLSGQLARQLKETYAVAPEELVILLNNRTEWMIISILAVLKAGAAYVPVDPEYPASRISYICEDSGARLLLTDTVVSAQMAALLGEKTIVDVPGLEYAGETYAAEVLPHHLAYVIYTSGTTGNPKGVLIEHRNVNRLLFNDNDLFDFDQHDKWSLFHSYCFDFSVWEMYGALLKGGTLVMVSKLVAQDSTAFFEFLRDERITVLNQTPTAFRSLCLTNGHAFDATPLAVRYVVFGGEALMPNTLKDWHQSYPACQLINMYGITETTVHVTYKAITIDEITSNQSNIGVPIPTLSCYVLDADLQPTAVGVVGELCVGGAGVARGYHNKPELTAEKFAPHPFISEERIYRSGDFARLLENGEIEYIGRKDDQVKIRGHRIELPEVEAGVKSLPAVKDAVVLVLKNAGQEYELVAYIIQEGEASQEPSSLRKQLHGVLPGYMIPSHFIFLETFPLTSNGKLDKRALPQPSEMAGGLSEYVAPRNEIDEAIVVIWQETLEKERVGITDNFFDLGGHSLKATRVISQIQERYNVKIDLASLFIDPTIESLSNHVSTMLWMTTENEEIESQGEELII